MSGTPQPPKVYAQEGSGRPSKFTPERCASIIDAISHRIPYEMAAEANGICEDTLYEWLKIGRKHHKEGILSEYAIFSEALKKAEMTKVRQHLDIVAERPERWQADAWILERRWYKHFGANAQLNELNKRMDKLDNGNNHDGNVNDSKEESRKED